MVSTRKRIRYLSRSLPHQVGKATESLVNDLDVNLISRLRNEKLNGRVKKILGNNSYLKLARMINSGKAKSSKVN